jgi:hypothetical protein
MIDAPTGLVLRSSNPKSSDTTGDRLLTAAVDTIALLGSLSIASGAFAEMAIVVAAGASPLGLTIIAVMASMEVTAKLVDLLSDLADKSTSEKVHKATNLVTVPGLVVGALTAAFTRNEAATLEAAKIVNLLYNLGSLERPVEDGVLAAGKHVTDVKEFTDWLQELLDNEQKADWVNIHFNQNTFIVPSGCEAGNRTNSYEGGDRTARYKVVV